MSNQPPSDPQQPDNPQPLGPPRSGDGTSSGNPLADGPPPSVPYPTTPPPAAPPPPGGSAGERRPAQQPDHRTFQPGKASLPQPAPDQEARNYPPTSQFPPHSGPPAQDQRAGYGPPPDYAAPGYNPPDYAPSGYTPPDYAAPGYAAPGYGPPQGYPPPTAYAAAPPGEGGSPPGYGPGQPGYGPPQRPPKRSNAPLIAVILAVAVLLCGGAATAGVLVVNNVTDRAKEAIEPITNPTLPALPTEVPDLPTEIPDLPTEIPDLPTDLPTLPTDFPGLPGNGGKKITVVYEVTGDGPAEIIYTEKLGQPAKQVSNAKLPWKFTTTMEGAALIAVSAFRSSTESGEISCRATVDGEEVVQKTREGRYANATCTKMVLN